MEGAANTAMLRVQKDESTGQQKLLFWHHIQAFKKITLRWQIYLSLILMLFT